MGVVCVAPLFLYESTLTLLISLLAWNNFYGNKCETEIRCNHAYVPDDSKVTKLEAVRKYNLCFEPTALLSVTAPRSLLLLSLETWCVYYWFDWQLIKTSCCGILYLKSHNWTWSTTKIRVCDYRIKVLARKLLIINIFFFTCHSFISCSCSFPCCFSDQGNVRTDLPYLG